MTDDLVLWLRNEAAAWTNLTPRQDEMLRAAANRIEALEKQVKELSDVGDTLTKALTRLVDYRMSDSGD